MKVKRFIDCMAMVVCVSALITLRYEGIDNEFTFASLQFGLFSVIMKLLLDIVFSDEKPEKKETKNAGTMPLLQG